MDYIGQHGALPKESRMEPNRLLAQRLRKAMERLDKTTDIPKDVQELRTVIFGHRETKLKKKLKNKCVIESCKQILQESVDYIGQHGALPKESRVEANQFLAQRLRKAMTILDQTTDIPKDVEELRTVILGHRESRGWSKGERDRYLYVLKHRQTVMRAQYRDWCMAHNQQPRAEVPTLQMHASQGRTWAGQSPYPGFINLGNTCWMNAVLQCVFHCHAFRRTLHDQEDGPKESCVTRVAHLLRDYSHGIPTPQLADTGAKADILAPQ